MNYLYLLSFLPLPLLLNRWRGMGVIFTLFNYKIAGSLMYGLYYALLFGFITTWYIGILTFFLYLGAEHQGFGKWVGFLTKEPPVPQLGRNGSCSAVPPKFAEISTLYGE